ncbi:MAG TPA: MEDS domain-containing protein [Terriglobia bacterium]|nr:MEDS domain-containing protein [Terriglobia bacterium]
MNPEINRSYSLSKLDLPCRLAVRKDTGLTDISKFVIEGLQVGQQVIALAGAACLRELARDLSEEGLRPEALLRNGRLVFLTAPNCLSTLVKPDDPLQRSPLRTKVPLLRWVCDWSWAYSHAMDLATVLNYQVKVHDFIRHLGAFSLCTVHSQELARNSLLAVLADHRRAIRYPEKGASAKIPVFAQGLTRY